MSKNLAIYYNTTTSNPIKQEWLTLFAEGAKRHGWNAEEPTEINKDKYPYALIFGYPMNPKEIPTDVNRLNVLQHYDFKNVFMCEPDIFKNYRTKDNRGSQCHYMRFPSGHTANFPFVESDRRDISSNFKLSDYSCSGSKILICLNRGKTGFGAEGMSQSEYTVKILNLLKDHSDRLIKVRFHPAAPDNVPHIKYLIDTFGKRIEIDNEPDLIKSIRDSYAVITHASSAAAPAIIEGIPLFISGQKCFFRDMHTSEITKIENIDRLSLLDKREKFLKKYSNYHYTRNELQEGEFWRLINDNYSQN